VWTSKEKKEDSDSSDQDIYFGSIRYLPVISWLLLDGFETGHTTKLSSIDFTLLTPSAGIHWNPSSSQ
jgi:hypothetical protein